MAIGVPVNQGVPPISTHSVWLCEATSYGYDPFTRNNGHVGFLLGHLSLFDLIKAFAKARV